MDLNVFEHKGFDEINVTPLLDLAWTLLVVFIIAVTAAVQGIKVNLPKATKVPSLVQPKTRAISITANGQLYLNAYPVTMNQLETHLRQEKAANPELPVVIKGDAKVYYEKVVDILNLLQRLDIHQLGLVTQKLVK